MGKTCSGQVERSQEGGGGWVKTTKEQTISFKMIYIVSHAMEMGVTCVCGLFQVILYVQQTSTGLSMS